MTEKYDALFENAKKIQPSLAGNALITGKASQLLCILMKYDTKGYRFTSQPELLYHMKNNEENIQDIMKIIEHEKIGKLRQVLYQLLNLLHKAGLIAGEKPITNLKINESLVDLYTKVGESLQYTQDSQQGLPKNTKGTIDVTQQSLINDLGTIEESLTIKGINSIAKYARVLSNEVMINILSLLSNNESLRGTDIYIELRAVVQQPQISNYLRNLRELDLVTSTRKGKETHSSLTSLNKEVLTKVGAQFALLAPHIPAHTENNKK